MMEYTKCCNLGFIGGNHNPVMGGWCRNCGHGHEQLIDMLWKKIEGLELDLRRETYHKKELENLTKYYQEIFSLGSRCDCFHNNSKAISPELFEVGGYKVTCKKHHISWPTLEGKVKMLQQELNHARAQSNNRRTQLDTDNHRNRNNENCLSNL